MDQHPEIDVEIIRSLVQTGLLAIWERDYALAETILHGLSVYKSDLVQVTYSYTLLYQALGQTDQAIALLRKTAREQPGNDMAKSLLGFMLRQDARGGWRELLQQVVANAADAPAMELAKHLLQDESAPLRAPSTSAVNSPLDLIRA
jgi:lipopolysaccharide biosynthesis regulator YciM